MSALVLLAPELPGAVAVGYKIFTGCAVVAAAYGLPGRGRFARLCAWYALLNLLLCGAVVLPGVQSRNLSVSLPLSPGRLLASCAGVYAVLRALLYCFGRSGAPSVPATLEVAGVQLPVQAFHDTGFALQEPLSGKAVVLVQYPAVRHRLPQAARQYLDGWFAHSTAPPRRSWGCIWCPAAASTARACCLPCPLPCSWAKTAQAGCWRRSAAPRRRTLHGSCCTARMRHSCSYNTYYREGLLMFQFLRQLWHRLCARLRFCGGVRYLAGTASLPSPLSPPRKSPAGPHGRWRGRRPRCAHPAQSAAGGVPCQKYENSGVPAEDLISIGTIGLIKAVNTFTPERSIKLATYASRCIGNGS